MFLVYVLSGDGTVEDWLSRVEIFGVREESNDLAMYIKSSPTHE